MVEAGRLPQNLHFFRSHEFNECKIVANEIKVEGFAIFKQNKDNQREAVEKKRGETPPVHK
jgi:hypothetical protein